MAPSDWDDSESGYADTRQVAASWLNREGLLRPGDVVGGRWRLDSFLDGGGMGAVWRAFDLRLQEAVAVKLMNPELIGRDRMQERFLREARACAQLRGPNVVSIFDFDVDPKFGVPYMAMELLRGESLGQRLRRGPIGFLGARSLLTDVVSPLARAHQLGIVHRDLKPTNIYLAQTDQGLVHKLLDFGIAKVAQEARTGLTERGRILGTPNYASPQQVSDAATVDHRADIWSIGMVIYECLVGKAAFDAETPLAVVVRIAVEEPPIPSEHAEVPPGFDAWFWRATRRDPDERFGSITEAVDAFVAMGTRTPAPLPARPAPEHRAPKSRAWASDANQISIDVIDQLVFENALVKEFVSSESRHFVSGAKGCGKTLLLTYKRARIAERYAGHRDGDSRGVILVPEGRPYLDLMGDLRNVGRSNQALMANPSDAKRLWGFALRLSAVSYHPAESLEDQTLEALPPRLRPVAKGRRTEPTVVLKEVLQLTTTQIHKLLDETEMPLEHAVRSMHSAIMFFIDKTDQALRAVGRDAWVAMQAGLVEAAWDLMNTNAHIKVFATIREEAFSSYESDIKTNLFGATTSIRYTKADLRGMLERLTTFYEGLPLLDFVTIDVVTAPGAAQTEGVFDFLFRHTLGRPRDLVILASELSRQRAELDERRLKQIVYETSAGILVSNVFDEMRVFLEVLADRASRTRFLATLPYGVLTRDDLIEVWCKHHGVEREYYDDYGKTSPEVFHPFRELYDCGLLGIVRDDPFEDGRRQAFKQPHEPIATARFDLPRSTVYLLHPSLQALILELGHEHAHRNMKDIVIGHERPWDPHHDLLFRVQREMLRTPHPSPEVEDLVLDMLGELGRGIAAGRTLDEVRAELGDRPSFARLCQRLEALELDDLHLTLLEAFGNELRPTIGPT